MSEVAAPMLVHSELRVKGLQPDLAIVTCTDSADGNPPYQPQIRLITCEQVGDTTSGITGSARQVPRPVGAGKGPDNLSAAYCHCYNRHHRAPAGRGREHVAVKLFLEIGIQLRVKDHYVHMRSVHTRMHTHARSGFKT